MWKFMCHFVFLLHLFIYLNCFIERSFEFELLPYVQIDYLHYMKLAQCQAKCAQLYGHQSERQLLDGSIRWFQNTSLELYEICETGCITYSRGNSVDNIRHHNGEFEESFFMALRNGHKFWWESVEYVNSLNNKNSNATTSIKPGNSIVERLRVLCIERQFPTSMNDNPSTKFGQTKRSAHSHLFSRFSNGKRSATTQIVFDNFDALITADLTPSRMPKRNYKRKFAHNLLNEESDINVRFVVLWRQKQKISIGEVIERNSSKHKNTENDNIITAWTTASIETSNTFKVEGIQLDMLYRFMLLPIGPSGQLTEHIKSDWIDFQQILYIQKATQKNTALSFFPYYNVIDNVGTIVRWVNEDKTFQTQQTLNYSSTGLMAAQQKPLIFEGCHMQIEYSNKTTKIVETFVLDESNGFALRNLGFNSEYLVEVKPRQSLNPESAATLNLRKPHYLSSKFLSMTCSQIHGAGSLECDPEPVQNVTIYMQPATNSVIISWIPAAETHYILLYQLYYIPITPSPECALETTSTFLTANVTQAQIRMPMTAECEYELRIINYDLLGREANMTRRFVFNPFPFTDNNDVWFGRSKISTIKKQFHNNLSIIILIAVISAVTALSAIITISRICAIWRWKKSVSSLHPNIYCSTINSGKSLSTNSIVDV